MLKKGFTLLFLLLLFFAYPKVSDAAQFKDVPKNASYEAALNWAIENKILSGYSDGTFRPDALVTEAQFLKMYVRLLDFQGVKSDDYPNFVTYYNIANIYKLPQIHDYNYKGNEPITRGQVAGLIAYAKGQDGRNVEQASAYMMAQKISSGQNPAGKTKAEIFGATSNLKRYHAVVFLYNAFQKDKTLKLAYDPYKTDFVEVGPAVWKAKKYIINADTYYKIEGDSYKNPTIHQYYKGEIVASMYLGKGNGAYNIAVGDSYESFLKNYPYTEEQIEYEQTAIKFGSESRIIDGVTVTIETDAHRNHEILAVYVEDPSVDFIAKGIDLSTDWKSAHVEDAELLFVEVTNAVRTYYGYAPAAYHKTAASVSRKHAIDLMEHNIFGHDGSDGSNPWERLDRHQVSDFIAVSEIVSGGTTPLDHTFSFLNSFDGHRDSILSPVNVYAPGYAIKPNEYMSGYGAIVSVYSGTIGQ